MTEERIEVILTFLHDLKSDPQAAVFQMPVNWRALSIPDYPQIVKNPMDLQTLEAKARGEYKEAGGQLFAGYTYFDEFQADLDLVWSNCKLYNLMGSPIYR